MVTTLNRKAFGKLISEDLDWLAKQPDSLEARHIHALLTDAVAAYYERPDALRVKLAKAREALEKYDPSCHPGCASAYDPDMPEAPLGDCDCGLADLRAALKEIDGKEGSDTSGTQAHEAEAEAVGAEQPEEAGEVPEEA